MDYEKNDEKVIPARSVIFVTVIIINCPVAAALAGCTCRQVCVITVSHCLEVRARKKQRGSACVRAKVGKDKRGRLIAL